MHSGRQRPGPARWLAALVVVSCMSPAQAGAKESIDLTERLTVDARGDYAWITSSGTAEVDADSRVVDVRSLQLLHRHSSEYEGAVVGATLSRWLKTSFTVNPTQAEPPRPRPMVSDGRAAITTATSDWINGYEPPRGLGDWQVDASGDHMHFSITPADLQGYDANFLPDALTLRVRLDLQRAELLTANTPPDMRMSGKPIEWTFRAARQPEATQLSEWRSAGGARIDKLDITVAPAGDARGFMTTNSGVWFDVQPGLNALCYLLVFTLLALARWRWRDKFPWERLTLPLGVAVAAWALMLVITAGEQQWRRVFADTAIAPWMHWESVAVFTLMVTALAAVLILSGRLRQKVRAVVIAAVMALVVGYFLVRPDPSPDRLPSVVLAVLAVASVVVMIAATAWLLVLLARWAFGASSRRGSLVAAAVLGAVLLGTWLWSALHLREDSGEITDLGYSWAYQGSVADIADALVAGALSYPGWLADAGLTWLPFVALVGTMAALAAARGDEARSRPIAGATAVVAALFVAFVAGPWGQLFSVRVPVTGLVAVAVLTPMLIVGYRRASEAEDTRRGLLSGTSAALHRLRAGPGAGAGVGDPDGHDEADPRRQALADGPTKDWWENGRLAIRAGLLIAIPFAVHYLVLLYTSQASFLSPHWNPIGPLWALQWLVAEYAFWLVGAFALGALYTVLPTGNGMTKGALLALVFVLAQGVADALPGTFDVMSWPAISAEVVVFFVVTGIWLDGEALRAAGYSRTALIGAYGLEHWEAAARLVPVAGFVVLVLFQQLISGEASNAISDILQAVPVGGGPPVR